MARLTCCNKDLMARAVNFLHLADVSFIKAADIGNLIECNLFSPWYNWKIAHLTWNSNHSLTRIFSEYSHQICWLVFHPDVGSTWIFIMLAHRNNSPRVDKSLHSDSLSWFQANQSLFLFLSDAFIFIVIGLTWPGIKPTIYHHQVLQQIYVIVNKFHFPGKTLNKSIQIKCGYSELG
jgi:hypothetical protein